jgi:hypothetical protein
LYFAEDDVPSWTVWFGFLFLLGGACSLTLFRSWPRTLIALAVQSLGLGLVAAQISPPSIAAVKSVVGWIAVALLSITLSRERRPVRDPENQLLSVFFRFSLLLFLFSSIVALQSQLAGVFGNPPSGIAFAACFLIGAGLLNIGLAEQPLRSGVSLLMIFQGFELGYLWIEQSLLVLALLAATDLAVVLTLIVHHVFTAPLPQAEGSS